MQLINTTSFLRKYCACDQLKTSNMTVNAFKTILNLDGLIPESAMVSQDSCQSYNGYAISGCRLPN